MLSDTPHISEQLTRQLEGRESHPVLLAVQGLDAETRRLVVFLFAEHLRMGSNSRYPLSADFPEPDLITGACLLQIARAGLFDQQPEVLCQILGQFPH